VVENEIRKIEKEKEKKKAVVESFAQRNINKNLNHPKPQVEETIDINREIIN